MTVAPLHLAHQFDDQMHEWLRGRLPAGTRIDQLPPDDIWSVKPGTEVLLVTNGRLRHLQRDRPAWAAGLRWMHTRPTGLDDAPDWVFDLPLVTVSRGAAAVAISEYVLSAMLDFERGLPAQRVTSPSDWRMPPAGGLAGRSLGLFGFGEIGHAVAARALAFGMTVRATRRSNSAASEGVELVPLAELCATSDHLVLCAPLTEETRGIFDDATFARCKPGQHLVNIARGSLIQPDALARALDGPIARATLDVWPQEPPAPGDWVYDHPRILLTPHSSFRSQSTMDRVTEILSINLAAWLDGRPDAMIGRVDKAQRY